MRVYTLDLNMAILVWIQHTNVIQHQKWLSNVKKFPRATHPHPLSFKRKQSSTYMYFQQFRYETMQCRSLKLHIFKSLGVEDKGRKSMSIHLFPWLLVSGSAWVCCVVLPSLRLAAAADAAADAAIVVAVVVDVVLVVAAGEAAVSADAAHETSWVHHHIECLVPLSKVIIFNKIINFGKRYITSYKIRQNESYMSLRYFTTGEKWKSLSLQIWVKSRIWEMTTVHFWVWKTTATLWSLPSKLLFMVGHCNGNQQTSDGHECNGHQWQWTSEP